MQIHPRCFLPKTAMATWLDNILNVKKWVIFSKKKKNQICQNRSFNESHIALRQKANTHEQQVLSGG